MSTKHYKSAGDDIWRNKTDKIPSELFTMTYGALVIQLIKDYQSYSEVNAQLDSMGYNIGVRLIEDFLARAGPSALPNGGKCSDFRETADVIAKVAFRMFLNISPAVVHHAPADAAAQSTTTTPQTGPQPTQEFSLIFDENPLSDFVELPPDARQGGLWWSNVYAGVLRGALEMVQMQVSVRFVSDVLRGDESTELRVGLVRFLEEEAPPADD